MRGGYSECNVIISDEKIASPYADHPDIVFLMKNDGPVVEASVERYEAAMPKDGVMYINKNALDQDVKRREDVRVVEIPATDIATEQGRGGNANLVLLGNWLPNPACSLMTSSKRPCASTLNPMERASSTKATRKCWLPERMLNGMLHWSVLK